MSTFFSGHAMTSPRLWGFWRRRLIPMWIVASTGARRGPQPPAPHGITQVRDVGLASRDIVYITTVQKKTKVFLAFDWLSRGEPPLCAWAAGIPFWPKLFSAGPGYGPRLEGGWLDNKVWSQVGRFDVGRKAELLVQVFQQQVSPSPLAGRHLVQRCRGWLSLALPHKWGWLPAAWWRGRALTLVHQHSSTVAGLFKTWFRIRVHQPWLRLVLQPTHMCSSGAGLGQRDGEGSFWLDLTSQLPQQWWFWPPWWLGWVRWLQTFKILLFNARKSKEKVHSELKKRFLVLFGAAACPSFPPSSSPSYSSPSSSRIGSL